VPQFSYEAVDHKGLTKTGKLSAPTEKDAVDKIKSLSLYPTRVYQVLAEEIEEKRSVHESLLSKLGVKERVSERHFIPFLSDLSSLINAGIPLVRSLNLLEKQCPSRALRKVIAEVGRDVEDGSSFSEALKNHPQVFSPLFVNMVRSGEIGGILDQVLNRLAIFAEKSAQLKARVQSATAYPMVVLGFALLVVLFLVAYVVPKMFVIFEDVGSNLPVVTLWLFYFSEFLRTKWYVLIGIIAGLIIALRFAARYEKVRYRLDIWKLHMPVFGALTRKVAIARFSRTFSTLTQSGVPILTTLSVVQESTGNLVFAEAIAEVRSSIREGEGIAEPLSHFSIFPIVVTNMIRVGEETGALAEILAKIADKYDEEVDRTLHTLTSLLEPVLIIILGLVVGFIVIALFLPMVPLVQNLSAM